MRSLTVTVQTPAGAVVKGHGSREELTRFAGRIPVWSSLSRGWCMQTCRVPDFVASCEMAGYSVTVLHENPPAPRPPVEYRPAPAEGLVGAVRTSPSEKSERDDPGAGLW